MKWPEHKRATATVKEHEMRMYDTIEDKNTGKMRSLDIQTKWIKDTAFPIYF